MQRKGEKMLNATYNELRKNVYPLTINITSNGKLEKMGRYDRSVCVIDPDSKPPTGNRGERFALFELVHLNRRVSNSEANKALGKLGYYPADIYALLTFGMHYPYVPSIFPIAGIAYSLKVYYRHTRPREFEMVGLPFLIGDGKDRVFDFKIEDGEWSEMTRFLVTRDRAMKTGGLMKFWKWW